MKSEGGGVGVEVGVGVGERGGTIGAGRKGRRGNRRWRKRVSDSINIAA